MVQIIRKTAQEAVKAMPNTQYITILDENSYDANQLARENRAKVTALFTQNAHNQLENYQFTQLPSRQTERSQDVKDVIAKQANQHTLVIDEPLTYVRQNEAIELIADVLAAYRIKLSDEFLHNQAIPGGVIKELYQLFNHILNAELMSRQHEYFTNLNTANNRHNKAIVDEGVRRARIRIDAARNALTDLQNKLGIGQQLLFTNVMGDGRCLYHRYTASFIYNILEGELGDEAHPANALFRDNLLPYIKIKAAAKGIAIDDTMSLQSCIIHLMQAYPIDSELTYSKDRIVDIIHNCNFSALSKQIFVPAMLDMILALSKIPEIKAVILPMMANEIIHDEENIDYNELVQRLENDDIYYSEYFKNRHKEGVYGGLVQQAIISHALHINTFNINQVSGALDNNLQQHIDAGELPPATENSVDTYQYHGDGHFAAYIGKPGEQPSDIAVALSEQFTMAAEGAYSNKQESTKDFHVERQVDTSDKAIQKSIREITAQLDEETITQKTSKEYEQDILRAALKTYGFFEPQQLILTPQEEADRRLAIQLQNEEILQFLNK